MLEELPAYRLRPPGDALPGRWMTGTQNHEGIAGTTAAIDYLAEIGRAHDPAAVDRRPALSAAYYAIVEYERTLVRHMLESLAELKDVRVWGITDVGRLAERVPTVAITHSRHTSEEIAQYLAVRGIFVWHGNYYALPLTETLGLEPDGMVRIGQLHYNTRDEIDRLIEALRELP